MSGHMTVDELRDAFKKQFHSDPEIVVRAPGRVNLIGEHTDYNEGFVFPVAIDREMLIAAADNGTEKIIAYSLDYKQMDSFDVKQMVKSPTHPWADYMRGVIDTMTKRKHVLYGFSAILSGNVPQGAGLSSSAAYEVAVALLCNELANLGITHKELALIAQQSENEFIGMKCGIMDQFISALAAPDSALLIDCKTLDFKTVPLNLAKNNASIVITNSGVRRGLVDSEYNARRAECAEGVSALKELTGKSYNSLRDVGLDDFRAHEGKLSEKVARRCRHVLSENKRVLDAVAALEAGKLAEFGILMNDSHTSLRDDFEVSCPELDILAELSQAHPGVVGARMTGGGFGGCTVAIMNDDAIESYKQTVIPEYEAKSGCKADVYICASTAGANTLMKAPAN